jgi:hypothetical protein
MSSPLRIFSIFLCALLMETSSAAAGIPMKIVFPDGREVSIALRPEPQSSSGQIRSESKLMDVFARYRKLAIEGNAAAANYLAMGLRRCKSAFRSEEELANAMYKLRAEGILALPDGTTMQMKLTPEQISRQEQTLREDIGFCSAVGSKELETLTEMNEIAAAGSGWNAASNWANSLGETPDGAAAWDYLWNQGYRQALIYLTSMSSSNKDPVRAYAYLLLNLRIAEAAQSATRDRREAGLVNRLRAASANWTSILSIQQQSKAEDLAYSMIVKNRACCYALWAAGP